MQIRKLAKYLLEGGSNHEHVMNDIYKAINGRISYGQTGSDPRDPNNLSTGLVQDNIDGAWGKIADTGVADTQFTVTHNLLRVPIGFHVVRQSKAGSFYDSGTTWTKTQIFLKCNVANVAATFFIF